MTDTMTVGETSSVIGLKRIAGRARKCGPAAISALAGIPTHEAAQSIRRHRNDGRPVNGVDVSDIEGTLEDLGYAVSRMNGYGSCRTLVGDFKWVRFPTLGQWLRANPVPGNYLILVTGHFIALAIHSNGVVWWADSCHRTPRPWTGEKQRCRVKVASLVVGPAYEPRF